VGVSDSNQDHRKDPPGEEDARGDRERALTHLEGLREETMAAAWGARRPQEERRQIVQAALILGRKLEDRLAQRQDELRPDEAQRFLMALINDTVNEFALQEDLSAEEATNFLSDVSNRDVILELNEALEASAESGSTLDEHLRLLVEDREDRAIWSDHWSSG
jgi:hypothetical protein